MPRGRAVPPGCEEEQLYLDLLWGRADSLSGLVGHGRGEAGLANGHAVDAEGGSVVVWGLIEGPGAEGGAGTSPPADPLPLPPRCPRLTPDPTRTHTNVTIWEAARSFRSMKAKYLARKGFLWKSSTRTCALTVFPISTYIVEETPGWPSNDQATTCGALQLSAKATPSSHPEAHGDLQAISLPISGSC